MRYAPLCGHCQRGIIVNEPHYSIIIPVYKNVESLPRLLAELTLTTKSIGPGVEIIFVVDGSPDASLATLIAALPQLPFDAMILELTRNFGSFSAIRAGMAAAHGDFLAVISADLQEPPELVAQFFEVLRAGRADIVLGSRTRRSDPLPTKITSAIFWRAYRRFIHRDIPKDGVDVFGCTRTVARVIEALPEANTSLIGLLFWTGYRKETIQYARRTREEGKSSWTLGRKLRYLTDSIYSFTGFPIVALQILGLVGIMVSIVLGLIVTVAWLTGGITETGYTPLMLVVTGSTSAILFALGIVGSYVWRTYENSKQRPSVIVRYTHQRNEGFGNHD